MGKGEQLPRFRIVHTPIIKRNKRQISMPWSLTDSRCKRHLTMRIFRMKTKHRVAKSPRKTEILKRRRKQKERVFLISRHFAERKGDRRKQTSVITKSAGWRKKSFRPTSCYARIRSRTPFCTKCSTAIHQVTRCTLRFAKK